MSIFAQLKQAYLIVDQRNDQIIEMNTSAEELLACSSDSLPDADWRTVFLPGIKLSLSNESSIIVFNQQRYNISSSLIDYQQQPAIAVHITLKAESFNSGSLDYFYSLLDNLGAYVYCKDKNYQYTYANRQVCDLFDCSSSEIVGKTDCDLFGEDTGRRLRDEHDRDVIEYGKEVKQEECNFLPKTSEYRNYLSIKKPLFDLQGNPNGLLGISLDITEQKTLQRINFENEQKLSTILDNAGAYIFIKDKNLRFIYINKRTQDLFQRSEDEILNKSNTELLGEIQGEEFSRTDRQVFVTGKKVTCIETFSLPDSTLYYWSVKIPLYNEEGEIDRFIGISTDITEQKELEKDLIALNFSLSEKIEEITNLQDKLQQQAAQDVLTGLNNRRHFEQSIEVLMSQRGSSSLTLLMLDVDHFKNINDQFGHSIGDEVLKFLAGVMSGECRSGDLVCRYGGEEFLIALPNADINSGFAKAEWIRQQFNVQSAIEFPELPPLSVSIGIAELLNQNTEFRHLFKQVDSALYKAKAQGRNCSVVATD